MSILEKTIDLLQELPEQEIEAVYSYVRFVYSQKKEKPVIQPESLEDIFGHLLGMVPDTGKTLEDYREERLKERYESID